MLRSRSTKEVRLWDAWWLVVALSIVGFVFYRNTQLASRVIDGTHLYVIDDDMMISMRYARNLAEGHGLVWNEGEKVEGYTNFLWTMVMALVHKLGAAEETASVWVRGCAFVFLSGALVQATRILRSFVPQNLAVTPLFLFTAIMCVDITLWASWGFETALLTFLLMSFVAGVLRNPKSIAGWLALSLVPLTRGDGVHIFLASALVGFLLADDRKNIVLTRILPAAVPVIGHFVFRYVYYGDILPNTYYLKVYLLDNVRKRGVGYARNFLLTYSILLALGVGGALGIAKRDRRGLVFLVYLASNLLYVCNIGGDMMGSFRFFAHIMPLVFVFAAAGMAHVARGLVAQITWGTVLAFISIPLVRPLDRLVALDGNGDPQEQMQVAMLIRKNALPASSLGVMAAGIVPYFNIGHRAVDALGKSDKHIAMLKPFPGTMVGHGKMDPDWTFNQRKPDLFVSLRSLSWTAGLKPDDRTTDPILSVLAAHEFQKAYRPNSIQEPWSLEKTAIYAREDSPEAQRRSWRPLVVGPAPR